MENWKKPWEYVIILVDYCEWCMNSDRDWKSNKTFKERGEQKFAAHSLFARGSLSGDRNQQHHQSITWLLEGIYKDY